MSEWIEWKGGQCPVFVGEQVDIKLRNGRVLSGKKAGCCHWGHEGTPLDIIAYRPHETTEQRIGRLGRELAELQAELKPEWNYVKAEICPDKWEPEDGSWFLYGDGAIGKCLERSKSYKSYKSFGTKRPTRELAEKARDAMRIHNRALAYVHEHAPDWQENPMREPWIVYYSVGNGKYIAGKAVICGVGSVQGPENVMQKLADELNAGIVEL